MSHKVVDYSFSRFSPAQLHDMGAVAVGRDLTVVNVQTEYAALAHEQHTAAGGPAGRPIYFGVDFDTPDYAPHLPNTPEHAHAKLGAIADYFHGINDTLGGPHLTGAYGGFGSYDVNDAGVDDFGQWRIGWQPGHPDTGMTATFPPAQVWHKVKPGDTLAAAYGTTVQAIAALNPDLITDVDVIDVGENIRIKERSASQP